jgi:GT2 family glycosyltransferase
MVSDFITSGGDPVVSVLVLNWNGAAILPRCLDALAAQSFRDFEVWVLDNASSDGSADDVETRWPGFHVARFERNLGFALANNRGAALARGYWLALLNNDAFPDPGWLAALMQAAQAYPEHTFFASHVVEASDPERLQAAGDVLHVSGCAWPRRNVSKSGGVAIADTNPTPANIAPQNTALEEVFSATAAAALYDRLAFLNLGGFAESFVSHLEDVDLGFRLRLAGYRCLYVPQAVVAHLGSASYGRESERTVYQVQRNLLWLYLADMPGMLFWKYLPAHLFAHLFFLSYYSLRGQAGAVWRAKRAALRGLPAALRRRKRVQAARRVAPAEIDRCLDHGWLSPYLLGRAGARLHAARGKKTGA